MEYVPPADGPGPYQDADPSAGEEGSQIPADVLEHPQQEILTAIKEALITPDGANLGQLAVATMPRRYLSGFTLTNNGTSPLSVIDIAPGHAREEGGQGERIASAVTVSIDITDANDRVDGSSLDASSTYHVLVGRLSAGGSFAAGFSKALAQPAGWRSYRRVGSVLTDASSNIRGFNQQGDHFYLDTMVQDRNSDLGGTSAVLQVLTVPTGIQLRTIAAITMWAHAQGNRYGIVSSPSVADLVPGSTMFNLIAALTSINGESQRSSADFSGPVLTDTSGRIRLRADDALSRFTVHTIGWIDHRGKE